MCLPRVLQGWHRTWTPFPKSPLKARKPEIETALGVGSNLAWGWSGSFSQKPLDFSA